jgi:hypothetical protein
MRFSNLIFATLAAVAFAVPASATSVALMDYSGFAWETGGVPVSDPGDLLSITAVALTYDSEFGVSPSSAEVTLYLYNLVSTGEFTDISGNTFIAYTGGNIEIYEDTNLDHDWDVFPPNAQQSTFTNGSLLFAGEFSRFNLVLFGNGTGAYDGEIDGVGGTAAQICTDCAYTVGGLFGREIGAQIPDGYDLQIDGTLEVDSAVSTDVSSFGAVKALFQD